MKQPTSDPVRDPERDALVAQWWSFCEANQRCLAAIPTFEEWKSGVPVEVTLAGL